MFLVESRFNFEVFKVYSVTTNNVTTFFLIYKDGWKWVEAASFEPFEPLEENNLWG